MENFKNKQGFTIIELLVAMSLFMVVTSIVTGVFIRSMKTQRTSTALIAASNNAELSIEQIAREIRTGFDFVVSPDNKMISFSSRGRDISYKFEIIDQDKGALKQSVNGGEFEDITADDVVVSVGSKFVKLDDPTFPDRITIIMGVGTPAAFGTNEALINIQTTVSSRVL